MADGVNDVDANDPKNYMNFRSKCDLNNDGMFDNNDAEAG